MFLFCLVLFVYLFTYCLFLYLFLAEGGLTNSWKQVILTEKEKFFDNALNFSEVLLISPRQVTEEIIFIFSWPLDRLFF